MRYIVELKLADGYRRYSSESDFSMLFRWLPDMIRWYRNETIRVKHGNTILFYILPGGEIELRK